MLSGFLEEIEGSETKRQLFPGKKARFIQQMANNKAGQLPQSGSISDCCPTGKAGQTECPPLLLPQFMSFFP